MSETTKDNIVLVLYLLVILLGTLSYFIHKKNIKRYNEKRIEKMKKHSINIVSRQEIPKPIDEALEYILIACYVVLTLLTILLSNKYSMVGISLLLVCAIFLDSITEKRAKKEGYDNGYTDGYQTGYSDAKASEE